VRKLHFNYGCVKCKYTATIAMLEVDKRDFGSVGTCSAEITPVMIKGHSLPPH